MKKILMALAVLAVATSVATAGVGIQWTLNNYAFDHTETDLVNGTAALLDTYSALWQLIYAGADNVANPLDSMNLTTGGPGIADDYVTGDDVVWAQRSIPLGGGTAPEDGTSWDNWMIPQGGSVVYEDLSWSTAGFVYQRVFEGTPTLGSWYYQTPLQALNTGYVGGGQPPQDFFLDTPTEGFQPNRQIPEPATMGLLGLGALVMAIRRRRS
jgi:hypothetical protein